jgi:serine/threonine protein kinase
MLYQEAVVWKRLDHPNIVPLLGITSTPLQLVSVWMSGGDLTEHITEHPDVNRLGLVGISSVVFDPRLIPTTSYMMLLKASASSTPATSFTVISRGYVIVPGPVFQRVNSVPTPV